MSPHNPDHFRALLHTRFGDNHTFFLLKPSVIERGLTTNIERAITAEGFVIVERRAIRLTPEDVDYFYRQEYIDLIPRIGEENCRIAIENAHRLYDERDILLLIARGNDDAIASADYLKGTTYWPVQCSVWSLRYDFRDTRFDDFTFIVEGRFVFTPCDNVVHTARSMEDFFAVCERFLLW